MPTTITRPDGTRSTYANITPASWAALEKIKPLKKAPRAKGEKRLYPKQVFSTAEYVREYFALNTCRWGNITAYADHLDHMALFQPLNEKRCHWAPDTVEVEMIE